MAPGERCFSLAARSFLPSGFSGGDQRAAAVFKRKKQLTTQGRTELKDDSPQFSETVFQTTPPATCLAVTVHKPKLNTVTFLISRTSTAIKSPVALPYRHTHTHRRTLMLDSPQTPCHADPRLTKRRQKHTLVHTLTHTAGSVVAHRVDPQCGSGALCNPSK